MAGRMWLQFDRHTTAGACWDLTKLRTSDQMGHHTWVQLWSSKSSDSIEKVDNRWWMAAKMWLQFDGRTMAWASWDLTKLRVSDPMGHHTWVVTIMEFKVKGINRKSWQLMMDENGENVITVWLVYNDTSKLQRPDWTKGVWPNGSPRLSGYNWGA